VRIIAVLVEEHRQLIMVSREHKTATYIWTIIPVWCTKQFFKLRNKLWIINKLNNPQHALATIGQAWPCSHSNNFYIASNIIYWDLYVSYEWINHTSIGSDSVLTLKNSSPRSTAIPGQLNHQTPIAFPCFRATECEDSWLAESALAQEGVSTTPIDNQYDNQ
jgi:hypothetical protein